MTRDRDMPATVTFRAMLCLVALAAAACVEEAPQLQVATAPCSPGAAALVDAPTAEGAALADPQSGSGIRQVTFYGDLLPVLSSQVSGAVYKCTTCHAMYETPDSMNRVVEIDRIIESMEVGRMPRGGNPVPQQKIDLFRTWALQGFKPGSKGAKPSANANGEQPLPGSGGSTSLSSSPSAPSPTPSTNPCP